MFDTGGGAGAGARVRLRVSACVIAKLGIYYLSAVIGTNGGAYPMRTPESTASASLAQSGGDGHRALMLSMSEHCNGRGSRTVRAVLPPLHFPGVHVVRTPRPERWQQRIPPQRVARRR